MRARRHAAPGATLPVRLQVELKTGELYRGMLLEAEDNWNSQMKDITVTGRARAPAAASFRVPDARGACQLSSAELRVRERAGRARVPAGERFHSGQQDSARATAPPNSRVPHERAPRQPAGERLA